LDSELDDDEEEELPLDDDDDESPLLLEVELLESLFESDPESFLLSDPFLPILALLFA